MVACDDKQLDSVTPEAFLISVFLRRKYVANHSPHPVLH